jgi:hypothetical protein
MYNKIKTIKEKWKTELQYQYDGELEIDYLQDDFFTEDEQKLGCNKTGWYVCVYKDNGNNTSNITILTEFGCIGTDYNNIKNVVEKLGIPICV